MANELLDFVMGLVRDPDAAARYAADPAQAIADAHLTDVTSADVNNLIPMVSDSLSMAAPTFDADATVDEVIDSNVWTSGAATAAFDAFAPPAPVDMPDAGGVIDVASAVTADPAPVVEPAADTLVGDRSVLLSDIDADPFGADQAAPWEEWTADPQPPDEGHAAFDLFD
jgi:hypothetical protein